MELPDPLIGSDVFQIAFVVRDLRAALARYSALFGVPSWRCYAFGASLHTTCEYRGGPTDFSVQLALSDSSPQFELIQPVAGPSIHEDFLNAHGEGLQHLGVIVDSVPRAVERMARAGYEVTQSGSGFGAAGDGAYAYFGTEADLGVSIEAVEPPDRMPPPDFLWPGSS
jgi:catechol 2,3-dioxygenase-like lactoylglutathione lyase family enzyme